MKYTFRLRQFGFFKTLNIALGVLFVLSAGFIGLVREKKVEAQFIFGPVSSAAPAVSAKPAISTTPFGGLSTEVFYCDCSDNIAVTINDLTISPPLAEPIIYQPGVTTLYPFGQITTVGVWTLGLWQPGGECRYSVAKGCSTLSTQGTMTMVGTSMVGSPPPPPVEPPPAPGMCPATPLDDTCMCKSGIHPLWVREGYWLCPDFYGF